MPPHQLISCIECLVKQEEGPQPKMIDYSPRSSSLSIFQEPRTFSSHSWCIGKFAIALQSAMFRWHFLGQGRGNSSDGSIFILFLSFFLFASSTGMETVIWNKGNNFISPPPFPTESKCPRLMSLFFSSITPLCGGKTKLFDGTIAPCGSVYT